MPFTDKSDHGNAVKMNIIILTLNTIGTKNNISVTILNPTNASTRLRCRIPHELISVSSKL